MTDQQFTQDQEVRELYFNWDPAMANPWIKVGENGVEKITVQMERGQMSYVAWFVVWRDGKADQKWNAALVEGVLL